MATTLLSWVKPQSYDDIQGQYTGLIKIRADHVPKLLTTWQQMDKDALYDGNDYPNMYMTSFLQHLINSGWEARAALIENGWAEVDCQEDLKVATHFGILLTSWQYLFMGKSIKTTSRQPHWCILHLSTGLLSNF